jgi:hypothetical protein
MGHMMTRRKKMKMHPSTLSGAGDDAIPYTALACCRAHAGAGRAARSCKIRARSWQGGVTKMGGRAPSRIDRIVTSLDQGDATQKSRNAGRLSGPVAVSIALTVLLYVLANTPSLTTAEWADLRWTWNKIGPLRQAVRCRMINVEHRHCTRAYIWPQ